MFNQSSDKLDFVIDGSNVILERRISRTPSVRLFAALLHMLDQHRKTYKIWFDNSIRQRLQQRRANIGDFDTLLKVLESKQCVEMAPRADPRISTGLSTFRCSCDKR